MRITPQTAWAVAIVLVLGVVVIGWVSTRDGRDAGRGAEVAPAASAQAPAQLATIDTDGAGDSEAPEPAPGRKHHSVAVGGSVVIPLRYQFAGVTRVQTGHDFEDWMSHYSPSDQKIIRAFNKRNFGVYRHRTAEQIAWMAANGYPMPEDVLAAQAMGTTELLQLAQAGSVKAAFLLKSRHLRKASRVVANGNRRYGDVALADPQISDNVVMLQKRIHSASSPFKAYVAAHEAMAAAHDPSNTIIDAQVIAALAWAKSLGDAGADASLVHFITADADRERLRRYFQQATIATAHYFWTLPRMFDEYRCDPSVVSRYPLGDPGAMQ